VGAQELLVYPRDVDLNLKLTSVPGHRDTEVAWSHMRQASQCSGNAQVLRYVLPREIPPVGTSMHRNQGFLEHCNGKPHGSRAVGKPAYRHMRSYEVGWLCNSVAKTHVTRRGSICKSPRIFRGTPSLTSQENDQGGVFLR
jgi:hypothetical protein